MPSYSITDEDERMDDWLVIMSYLQNAGGLPVPPRYDTRIKESKDQNKPEGALVPPRTGRPLTILPVATLVSFASAPFQSNGLPAELFLIKPALP